MHERVCVRVSQIICIAHCTNITHASVNERILSACVAYKVVKCTKTIIAR
jgi:hypothetical protein